MLPKIKVPQVGCTLRSLSHNLALLPPKTTVKVQWHSLQESYISKKSINILLVPFPFDILGTAFSVAEVVEKANSNYFNISPNWIETEANNAGTSISHSNLVLFMKALIKEAELHVGAVDIVIFPEASMNDETFKKLRDDVLKKVNVFIAGVIGSSQEKETGSGFSGNAAAVSFVPHRNTKDIFHRVSE